MRSYIDLHCHVLPGLDDGSPDLDQAVALAVGLHELGFDSIHPTPHQKELSWQPSQSERAEAADMLRSRLAQVSCPLEIAQPGGENMWDGLFFRRQTSLAFPTYEGNRAVLVEFPVGNVPTQLPERFFELRMKGILPVVAHVERFPEISGSRKELATIEGKAALLVNLSTIAGIAGWGMKRLARRLVRDGAIHALTTDAHSVADLEHCKRAIDWLDTRLGTDVLEQLLIAGPRQILHGEIPD